MASLIKKSPPKKGWKKTSDGSYISNQAKMASPIKTKEEQIREVFAKLDTDQSGFLDAAELGNFVEQATGARPSGEEISYMISQLDADGNGKISFEELLVIAQSREALDLTNQPQLPSLSGEFEAQTCLVIPSTGNVGFLVAQALAKVPNFTVKCGVRKTSHPGVVELVKGLGVEVVECDHSDKASLAAAMAGVDRVLTYSPTTYISSWSAAATNVAAAAKEAGVKCMYWVTGQHTVLNPDSAFVKNRLAITGPLDAIGMPYVEIRPNNLVSNLYAGRDTILKSGTHYIGYKADRPCVMTHPSDVAQLAATLMTLPVDAHAGKSYNVTGPAAHTAIDVAGMLTRAIQAEESKGRKRVAFRDNLLKVFQEIDTNGDGAISVEELAAALQKKGYSAEQSAELLKIGDTDKDGNLSPEEFVNSMGRFFDRPAAEKAVINAVTLPAEAFTGFLKGVGMGDVDIALLLSLFSSFDEGRCGQEAIDTTAFAEIVGRQPMSVETWIKENVGAFMASHWDLVTTHARQDLTLKAAFA